MQERTTYQERRKGRQLVDSVKQSVSFGLLIGGIAVAVAGWKVVFTLEPAAYWRPILWVGIALVACAVVVPQVLSPLQKAWAALGNVLGKVVLTVILSTVYVLIVLPIGVIRRRWMPHNPFLPWPDGVAPAGDTAWKSKTDRASELLRASGRGAIRVGLSAFSFFWRQQNWFLFPALLVLVVLGMLFFFVQGSALAPMIYTLF